MWCRASGIRALGLSFRVWRLGFRNVRLQDLDSTRLGLIGPLGYRPLPLALVRATLPKPCSPQPK